MVSSFALLRAGRVADQAATGANRADGAHPQGGRQAEPERSERLARLPAGADTAAADSHTTRPSSETDTRRVQTNRAISSELIVEPRPLVLPAPRAEPAPARQSSR
jgi:hypothetical protein